jgi:Kef-type K+ transport system membrane component KefB
VPIMLLSLFFSAASKTTEDQVVSLAIFLSLLVLIGLALARVRRLQGLDRLLDHLEGRSGQLRVRAALTLALGCGVLAYRFGFASILGAFAAGLLVRLIEISGHAPDPQFKTKLEGIGFGFLIPIFFITTGVSYQLKSLLAAHGCPVPRGGTVGAIPGQPWPQRQGFELSSGGKEHYAPG